MSLVVTHSMRKPLPLTPTRLADFSEVHLSESLCLLGTTVLVLHELVSRIPLRLSICKSTTPQARSSARPCCFFLHFDRLEPAPQLHVLYAAIISNPSTTVVPELLCRSSVCCSVTSVCPFGALLACGSATSLNAPDRPPEFQHSPVHLLPVSVFRLRLNPHVRISRSACATLLLLQCAM